MYISVFRKAHFNAAHRLHNIKWSEEKNKAVFGICNNPYYHGHNYELEVRLSGEVDAETGFLIDLKKLSDLIKEHIEDKFDHKNLNMELEEFKDLNPTVENIAYVIWQILRKQLDEKYELMVRLYETPRNYVEYDGR